MANIIMIGSPNVNADGKIETYSLNPQSSKISLRGYQLHDNIILKNFENITQLEVSGNNIEYLDLSTLKKLEILQCRRNMLSELTLNGESLLSITASYNADLTTISILPEPCKLTYLDIRCNKLSELPQWLNKCQQLQSLYANNNLLEDFPDHLITSGRSALHTLQLANNKLKTLPNISKGKTALRELYVQCNQLKKLPDNLFLCCNELLTLNVSNNSLEALPAAEKGFLRLERLLATKNHLNDTVLHSLMNFKKLKTLHLAYNELTTLPSKSVNNWPELEELVVSGNKLESLPESLSSLRRLKVLRLHSNQLESIPDLSKISTLRVIDLAHNKLGKINLTTVLPTNVQFVDLSCNQQLLVDSGQLKSFQSQRKMSFVDVSGKNRFSLPTSVVYENNSNSYAPWQVGFSETAGNCPRLYISQLRLPNFCNTDGLFGLFDGATRNRALSLLPKIIPTILLQQRTVKDTTAEYMKYTLITAFNKLKQNDKKYGDCAILCHITKEKPCHELSVKPLKSRKYILRAAMIGGTTAYLIRKQGPMHLPPASSNSQIENDRTSALSVEDADIFEVSLSNDDEYLVIGSKRIWETMQIETIVQEIRSEENVILAAKRIQDVAQSFGAEENLSIIILKFQNVETYVDLLIHELRQNVRRKMGYYNCSRCSYSPDGGIAEKQLCAHSDRPSPIGQTDQEISELSVCLKRIKTDAYCFAESGISSFKLQSCGDDNQSKGFQALEEESEQNINETDSVLSEEQYKCWEYMLEQNTQLLFDKELNKISNSFPKTRNSASSINLNDNNTPTTFNLMQSAYNKKMSASFPQLIHKDAKEHPTYQKESFASKHFGTAKLYQQFASKTSNLNSSDRMNRSSSGGANIGYFGSLQHLMPYNFENDFAVTHERQIGDESLEYASRMSQYWGVATTEL